MGWGEALGSGKKSLCEALGVVVFYRFFSLFLNDFHGVATEAQVEAVGAVLASGAGLHGAQYPDAHVRAEGVEAHRVARRPRRVSALYAKRASGQGEVGFAGRGVDGGEVG